MPPLSQDPYLGMTDDEILEEYENYGLCTDPYCVGCRGISHDDVEDYLELEAENLLAGLPKSAGIGKSTNSTSEEPKWGTCSPSIDLKSKHDSAYDLPNALELRWQPIKRKREEEADLSDNAYDLPNTLEQLWQPINRKREEEADLFSELPSPFALSDSEEHPGSPNASSYSPPINISKPKQASNHQEGALSLTWNLKAPSF